MTVGVIIRTREPGRVAEALRAAVGLTLRGARVVVAGEALRGRAADVLREMGHAVGVTPGAALAADVVEVWT
jgi:hypothetical protein